MSLAIVFFTPVAACTPSGEKWMETFEVVCRTIDERFYDPGFGGKDWDAITAEFRPRIEKVKDNEKFFVIRHYLCGLTGKD